MNLRWSTPGLTLTFTLDDGPVRVTAEDGAVAQYWKTWKPSYRAGPSASRTGVTTGSPWR